MLTEVADSEGINAQLNPWGYNEDLLILQDRLKAAFWRLVDQLTPRQKEVIKLLAQDKTQTEIAKKLGVNQSSVTKSVNGNCDYKGDKKVFYGGSKKRLIKLAEQDVEIREILIKIREIQSDEDF
jgi:DNA-binding CsgD family transcriptional regulator